MSFLQTVHISPGYFMEIVFYMYLEIVHIYFGIILNN